MALGATRSALLWLVMRQASTMLLTGTVIGAGMALISVRFVRGFLFGVNPYDGWSLAGAAVLLLVTGLTAAYLPARHAAHVSPVDALRAE